MVEVLTEHSETVSTETTVPLIIPRSEHPISRKRIDEEALKILYRLSRHGFLAYLVGGSVRDLLLGKAPKEIRYIFKHFPFESEGKAFELSEMAAAAQDVSSEAFWIVHDFFFTPEGQNVAKLEKKAVQTRVEQMLREKKMNVKAFQAALENGKGKQRVLDDMALGKKLRITGTPTKVVNGDIIVGSTGDAVLEKYLAK